MKEIMDFVYQMKEEIEDAECYYKEALYYKDNNNEYSRRYADLAKQELNHAMILHDMAVTKINEVEEKGIKASAGMKEMWNKAHVEWIAKMKEIEYAINRL